MMSFLKWLLPGWLAITLSACNYFDPERDSDLMDLHVSVDSRSALLNFPDNAYQGASLKIIALVYHADTLVASQSVIGSPMDSYSFSFPRLNKELPYLLRAYGSFVTGPDTNYTDVWSVLPLKFQNRHRAERIPHSFGALDWLGMGEKEVGRITPDDHVLSIHSLGQLCQITIDGWRETDIHRISVEDMTRIRIGKDGAADGSSLLTPVLPTGADVWLCLFRNPAETDISVTRIRDGITDSLIIRPMLEGGVWKAKIHFQNNE